MEKELTAIDSFTPERQRLLRVLQEGTITSISDLCEQAKVTRQTYYNAINDEQFVKAMFQDSTGLIYASIPEIMNRILKQAKNGSFVHQKMLLEMVKLYQGTPQQQTNIQNNITFQWKE